MLPGSTRQSTRNSMLLLVRLLGSKCAKDKLEEFSQVAAVLRVKVDAVLLVKGRSSFATLR